MEKDVQSNKVGCCSSDTDDIVLEHSTQVHDGNTDMDERWAVENTFCEQVRVANS